jgi:hypothetical protein
MAVEGTRPHEAPFETQTVRPAYNEGTLPHSLYPTIGYSALDDVEVCYVHDH